MQTPTPREPIGIDESMEILDLMFKLDNARICRQKGIGVC